MPRADGDAKGPDLEGAASTVAMEEDWYYEDAAAGMQGPYTHAQIRLWHRAGYIPSDTRLRRGATGAVRMLKDFGDVDNFHPF